MGEIVVQIIYEFSKGFTVIHENGEMSEHQRNIENLENSNAACLLSIY